MALVVGMKGWMIPQYTKSIVFSEGVIDSRGILEGN